MQAWLPERALVGSMAPLSLQSPIGDASDELSGSIAIDDFCEQRTLTAVQLFGHAIDEVFDDWYVYRGWCALAGPASQQTILPIQIDRSLRRLHTQCDEGPLGPMARIIEAEHLARMLE